MFFLDRMQNHVTDSDHIVSSYYDKMLSVFHLAWTKKEQRIQNLRFCCFDIKNNHDELQKDEAYVINAS